MHSWCLGHMKDKQQVACCVCCAQWLQQPRQQQDLHVHAALQQLISGNLQHIRAVVLMAECGDGQSSRSTKALHCGSDFASAAASTCMAAGA
jgi:hypothetical protein